MIRKTGVREIPFGDVPETGAVIKVAKGIFWARIPLPWSLDHINVYLIEEENGWTVIDTGSQGKRGCEAWELLEENVLKGRPITRVIATHMHPDHLGLAGWLVDKYGAEFCMTQAEYLLAQVLWLESDGEFPQHELDFFFSGGVDRQVEAMIRSHGTGHFKRGVHRLPPVYTRLREGAILSMGGRSWQVIIGSGHSPEHACLYCLDEPIFISGDQVLPEITSNVSVHARDPHANPLAQWINTKNRLLQIPGDPLVLPAHGPVFKGLQSRVSAVIEGHFERLDKLHNSLKEEWHTPIETFKYLFRRKITGVDFFLALGEARAHLSLLLSLDLVEKNIVEGVEYYRSIGSYDEPSARKAIENLPEEKLVELSF
ncbi:zinc metallohydrolase glyoxalase II family protein [Kordiimonas sediminis]|uniref:Zinc metallohydrolase glyoxalase II family protein n=1 Tax=Kordiimonas sediminis TaxID=1735581 RepID=A0A919AWM1_9PROT|nr:MBL fold metallo-hydrolase [Kordiimonas sediminis]GHF26624.1 zinc metallohydrolase glyoxalase II family protein [Kordiimonas sediminis]